MGWWLKSYSMGTTKLSHLKVGLVLTWVTILVIGFQYAMLLWFTQSWWGQLGKMVIMNQPRGNLGACPCEEIDVGRPIHTHSRYSTYDANKDNSFIGHSYSHDARCKLTCRIKPT